MKKEELLTGYIRYFETLKPSSLHHIKRFADPEFRFKDPFNDVQGYSDFMAVMGKMFNDVHDPKFKVFDHGFGQTGEIAFLRWDCSFSTNPGKPKWVIQGMSELMINPKTGKIISHVDHWDSGLQFYARLPVIGAIIRFIQKKMKI